MQMNEAGMQGPLCLLGASSGYPTRSWWRPPTRTNTAELVIWGSFAIGTSEFGGGHGRHTCGIPIPVPEVLATLAEGPGDGHDGLVRGMMEIEMSGQKPSGHLKNWFVGTPALWTLLWALGLQQPFPSFSESLE